MDVVLPNYVTPCLSERTKSIESRWLYEYDFGECYREPSDLLKYPRVIPVYNGKVLGIDSEFVHDSLSGISIKHFYGKCFEEKDEQLEEEEEDFPLYDEDYFTMDDYTEKQSKTSVKEILTNQPKPSVSTDTSTGDFEYRESFYTEGQPPCTIPKINYRNSFWNIHRPELSKLTWGQKYVGESTVTEHLHEHLLHHGYLCEGFHTREEREYNLNKELNEYVRLKVLACPRALPPDEPIFNLKSTPRITKLLANPKCKPYSIYKPKLPTNEDRCTQLSDDEEIEDRNIRRSKEEFCLTIGKHIRKPPITQVESPPSEEISWKFSNREEEGAESFYYNWFLFEGEEYEHSASSDSVTISISDVGMEPCSPHIFDEFCRAAGKVDFSDIRCNPDL